MHVAAAALNPSTKLMASGQHYLSPQQLPAVCGVEGVGRLDDGTRVFFGVRRPPNGSMCQTTAVPRAFCWRVPEGVSDAVAAALPNPGLSSWLPLMTTARLAAGETVLILGATGVAGQLAVQIAKHLGAGRVVAAGRNESILKRLRQLGADSAISLSASDEELEKTFAQEASNGGFSVVLDYLWGHPTEVFLAAMTHKGFPTQSLGTPRSDWRKCGTSHLSPRTSFAQHRCHDLRFGRHAHHGVTLLGIPTTYGSCSPQQDPHSG